MKKVVCGFSLYIKFSKFWSILLEHFVECKPLISDEWYTLYSTSDKLDPFSQKKIENNLHMSFRWEFIQSKQKNRVVVIKWFFIPTMPEHQTPFVFKMIRQWFATTETKHSYRYVKWNKVTRWFVNGWIFMKLCTMF